MSDPRMIREIIAAVSIPVMAKVRIGHMVEAQVKKSNEQVGETKGEQRRESTCSN